MKYSAKYPDAQTMELTIDKDLLLMLSKDGSCNMCHDKTRFIDVCSEDYMCSDECRSDFYELLERASSCYEID